MAERDGLHAGVSFRCDTCGWHGVVRAWPLRCRCGATYAEPSQPSLLQQAGSYVAAVTGWVASGSPLRSQEEVDRLLAICQACEHYRAGVCVLCGCTVDRRRSGWRNKLAMATESCPAGKW